MKPFTLNSNITSNIIWLAKCVFEMKALLASGKGVKFSEKLGLNKK